MKKLSKKRLIVIEDHTILRETLVVSLNMEDDLEVKGHWETAEEALEALQSIDFDVAIVDKMLPGMNGVEFVRRMKEQRPTARAMMLSMDKLEESVAEAFSAGADGYMAKDTSTSKLIEAIRKVAGGERVLAENLTRRVIDFYSGTGRKPDFSVVLNEEELLMLRKASEGDTNKEIGWSLGLKLSAIKARFHEIYRKLSVRDRASAVMKAIKLGLLRLDK